MFDQQQADAARVHGDAQRRRERLRLVIGQAGERLVEQEHRRLAGERATDLDEPAEPERERVDVAVTHAGEREQVEQVVDPLVLGARARPQ